MVDLDELEFDHIGDGALRLRKTAGYDNSYHAINAIPSKEEMKRGR